ncbi:hypothetical protein PAPHI01_0299 [Pancytospora philotis]|nr:hypothetical protein PAPHI01_0299 [Pancytospora philotis]
MGDTKEASKESVKETAKETAKDVAKDAAKATEKAAKEPLKTEPTIKFKKCDVDEKLKKVISDTIHKMFKSGSLPALSEELKKQLDKEDPKGWVVFAGKHLAGVCSFIKGTMVELEVNETAFVIFKTFCPST